MCRTQNDCHGDFFEIENALDLFLLLSGRWAIKMVAYGV